MTDAQPTQASSNGQDPAAGPAPSPIIIPIIDFNTPTGDQMVEVRKGFGLGEVGGSGHAAAVGK